MKVIVWIVIGILWSVVLTSMGCAQSAAKLVEVDNQFAFDLYTRLSSNDENIFFSPYSLSNALSMTYEGARGQTADEMRAVLRLSSDDATRRKEVAAFFKRMNRADKMYKLSTANALWAQKAYSIKKDYYKLIKNIYSGDARNLDFVADPEGSRATINSWVSNNTKNRINELLPAGSIGPLTRLVLTNTVYFNGKWLTPFQKERTKKDIFWISPAKSVQTAMMALAGESFRYAEDDRAQILELPYQGDDLSMLIILPRGKDVQSADKTASAALLKQWDAGMKEEAVNVFIPKFKFDSNYKMKDTLEEMGMINAFDGRVADFSGMTGHDDLYIDEVYHSAWVDVNEEGTEAAAATADVFWLSSMLNPPVPKIFRADHPFIFVIQDCKTKQILFMGRVTDPREN